MKQVKYIVTIGQVRLKLQIFGCAKAVMPHGQLQTGDQCDADAAKPEQCLPAKAVGEIAAAGCGADLL